MPTALQELLTGLVDYAGLFPPAALGMPQAVREYAEHRAGEHAWMLGRFVLPASRLPEFEAAAGPLLPREPSQAWRLSVLASADVEETVRLVGEFNCRRAEPGVGAAVADVLELKAASVGEIERLAPQLPAWLVAYVEVPVRDDPAPLIDALARSRLRAKVRTGGVTADAFPSAKELARFILACRRAGVPFKATAGLHHPLRGEYRLTYDAGSPSGTMFGFLNVFVAGIVAWFSARQDVVEAVLEERDPRALVVEGFDIRWRGYSFHADDVGHVRERTGLAFGSCSFREPVDDLRALGYL
ncbi:MAG TPA: hypothetical protein VFX50_02640 [Gemmatimonadales bacterium]|nr:hypothetical protein [Gemmatimonadales bacterium]